MGFSDPSKDAAILIAALPAAAYSQIEKTLDTDVLKKQGVTLEKREPMQLSIGKGLLLTGRQVADKARYRKWLLLAATSDLTALVTVQVPEQENAYSDRVVRAALATLAVRPPCRRRRNSACCRSPSATWPDLKSIACFQAAPSSSVTCKAKAPMIPPRSHRNEDPNARVLLAAMPGGPEEPDDRANFARLSFNEITGIRNVHITMSEPLRIGGQPGYQTMAEAKDARSGSDVMVVQWLRFGSSGFLQMVSVARADTWIGVLARLRAIRDSVEPK